MEFIPIASSSEGNCYRVIGSDSSQLLIEAGIHIKRIREAMDFRLSSVDACLISHEHNDHAKAVKDLLKAGVNVYMSEGTRVALGLKHHRIKIIEGGKQFKVGEFIILPFDVQHDANEPLGFLIQDSMGEKLLFATDTYYIRYRFKGLTIVAVECNYSEKILKQNIIDGVVPAVLKGRLERSHFSFENYKDFIRANDMSTVREIWLIHMSGNNSDSELFKREIQAITGKPVYIAGCD